MWKIQLTIKIQEDLIIKFPLVLLILEFELNFESKIKWGCEMMIHSRKLRIWLYLVLLAVFISACNVKEDKQIKENFNKTLSLYPTKNLEDFYDKEGFRDEDFEKGDKGTWIIYSEMVIEPKGKNMETRGMVLYINRNTRTTKGDFIVNEITDDNDGRPIDNKKKYPVKMEHNKIIPTKPLPNDKLKKRNRKL